MKVSVLLVGLLQILGAYSTPGDTFNPFDPFGASSWDYYTNNYGYGNCYEPTRIANGGYHGSAFTYSYGTRVSYFCNTGYSMQGSGSITCGYSGWEGRPPTCVRSDPCSPNPCYGSNQVCVVSSNFQHACNCRAGYTNAYGGQCQPRDPCRPNPCVGLHKTCQRTGSSYQCVCNSGYYMQGSSCIVQDPCRPNPCGGIHSTCRRQGTSYQCDCNVGYYRQGSSCQPRDPCSPNPCVGSHKVCQRSGTTYTCVCKAGYSFQGSVCKVTDPCGTKNCPYGHTCLNIRGRAICQPRNPCSPNPCQAYSTCKSTGNGQHECVCNSGYTKEGTVCQKLHPCALMFCGPGTKCVVVGDQGVCKPICGPNQKYNECPTMCPKNCANRNDDIVCTLGCAQDKCVCKDGYVQTSDSDSTCIPVDQCPVDVCAGNHCDQNAQCVPFDSESYNCVCNEGYEGPGRTCKKIVCHNNHCHANAKCVPFDEESYNCVCNPGYTGGGRDCRPIMPCERNPCHEHATCKDISTTKYECTCNAGYKGNGKSCTWIMPCETSPCDPNAVCTDVSNTKYSCDCNAGYRGDGKQCVRIWPCETTPCHPEASCTNIGYEKYKCDCNAGYSGNGKNCIPVTCVPPTILPENVVVISVKEVYSFNEPITYKCTVGYEVSTSENFEQVCQQDGTFGPDFDIECEDINECNMENGCHEYATCENTVGSYTCRCNNGYEGDGWQQCRKMCLPLSTMAYGRIEPSKPAYRESDTVRFICQPGYKRMGAEFSTCSNGEWSDPTPICLGKCKAQETAANVIQTPTDMVYDVNSQVFYSCPDGYTMIGQSVTTCTGHEQWSHPPPICQGKCKPQVINSMNLARRPMKPEYDINDVVEYRCRPGFNRVGERMVKCIGHNQWSNDVPSCTAVKCDAPGPPDNGYIVDLKDEYVFGSEIEYRCNVGYKFIVEITQTIRCGMDGMFTPEVTVVCGDINECEMENDCHEFAQCVNNVGSYTCECNIGYQGNGRNCISLCSPPSVMPHTSFAPDKVFYGDTETVRYICDNGYVRIGNEFTTCSGGMWTKQPPICIAKCLGPEMDENLARKPAKDSYDKGELVEYRCRPGWDLIGQNMISCVGHEQWSHPVPTCKRRQCTKPDLPFKVSVIPSQNMYDVNSLVVFKCAAGYEAVGETASQCQGDQTWSSSPPVCRQIGCKTPSSPHAIFNSPKAEYQTGEQVSATCAPGYEMVGSDHVVCGANGQWQGTITCKAGSCVGRCTLYLVSSSKKCRCGRTCRYNCCPDNRVVCGGAYFTG